MVEKSLYIELGRLMRVTRERMRMSQDEVSEKLGIHRITYTNLENGKATAPFHLVVKASEVLGFSLDALKDVGQSDLSANELIPPSVLREVQKVRSELLGTREGQL